MVSGSNEWTYQDQPFTIAPEDSFGFVYVITNLDSGRQYIGMKQLWSHRTKKVKGKKNRKHFTVESDWRKYWGSCVELKADISRFGVDHFTREIVCLYPTKAALTYGEVSHQIKADCLTATLQDGSPRFYNSNIMNRWFRRY